MSYNNDSNNIGNGTEEEFENAGYKKANVTGGRDHQLLVLLRQHMNFTFEYIEAPGRTQGSLRGTDDNGEANDSFTGGIGMLQSGVGRQAVGNEYAI